MIMKPTILSNMFNIDFQPFGFIRKHKKGISVTLAILFFSGMIRPQQLFALTGGPSAPEVNSPSKITSGKMVDPFTGNLEYSIPIMDVGDYPLSLSYNADISMDQEASWVGLGWTLNPGSVSRSVRGLPDDFNGEDEIDKEFNTKPNIKAGLSGGINLELFGLDALGAGIGANLGLFYDTYQGVGLNYSLSPSISVGSASKGTLTASMGMNAGSHQNGVSMSPSLSYSQQMLGLESVSLSSTFNSLSGLKSINVLASMKNSEKSYGAKFNSFADKSYTPKIEMPMVSTHGTFAFSAGGEVFGTFASGSVTGYYSQQHLESNHKSVPAFGYLYSDKANNRKDALLDFKREKDGKFTSNKTSLPIPNYTYDVFNVSGSGLSGSFRAHRGDIGVVYDRYVKSLGGDKAVPAVGGFSLSGEIGSGNLVKVGVDLKTNNSENTSGIWQHSNDILDKVSAKNKEGTNVEYEPFYFRMSGEKQVRNNSTFYNKILDEEATKVKLASNPKGKAYQTIESADDSEELTNHVFKQNRERRTQTISYLRADQATRMAVERKIRDYKLNSSPLESSSYEKINRVDDDRNHHHLSEITINKQGKRYIYGVPTYNLKKKEVAFNVDKTNADCENGLVQYDGTDNTTDNTNGLNNYFSSTTTPPYAYSYLLSSVVSENYVDISGDGPTPDDLGNYTRFNYSRIHKNYKWRTPYRKDRANYQENKYSLDNDNMANYVYGEKEIWYLHSMESRNYVAKFILTDRKDALGVKGEDGGKDTNQKLKKLSRIELYTRADLEKNGSNATPLKTAHFEYSYSLCQGLPNHVDNNNNGKLTLEKIYFTFGDSDKGYFSPYKFTYQQGDKNPSYSLKANDRFGFYKENTCGTDEASNSEFPYVNQDASKTNNYIQAWKLKTIKLPSGGTISIEYESDDYAYVQDKKAMQMFMVDGFTDNNNPAPGKAGEFLYENAGSDSYKVNEYLIFNLSAPLKSEQELAAYFPEEKHIYFKAKLDVHSDKIDESENPIYEGFSGFAKYEDYGLVESSKSGNSYSKAWIKMKKVNIGDYKLKKKYKQKKAHPFARRAWVYSKNHIPKRAFDRSDSEDPIGVQLKNALASLSNMIEMFKSLNSELINREFAQRADLNKTFIRLNNPFGKKLGGGHRVKKIVMNDQWSNMVTSGKNNTYGKIYKYTTSRNGQEISSGVIANEPRVGREENPLHQPEFYTHNGDQLFMTKPFGSSFYPGPSVGYSRVEIRSLPRPNAIPAPEGYEVREFYTAKDFPVKTEKTKLQNEHEKPDPLASLNPFKFNYNEKRAVSQGYKVVLNDMHGKPKAKYTYRHGTEVPLNGAEYKYQLNDDGSLNNEVRAVRPDNKVVDATIGVDIDMIFDARQQLGVTEMKGLNMNIDGFMASIVPIIIPMPVPAYKKETVMFRSMVASKVIRKKGLIDEVIAYKNGAKLATKNVAFDSETGDVTVKKTQNRYGKYTYHTTIPVHHIYDEMGPAYQNSLASFEEVSVQSGEINNSQVSGMLTKGDKLYYLNSNDESDYTKAWVLSSDNNNSVLIDMAGQLIGDGTYDIVVVRSGYDDKAGMTAATINSMNNPVAGNQLQLNNNLKVLSAEAKEYKDDWQTYTGFSVEHVPTECNCTMFDLGKGAKIPALLREIFFNNDGDTIQNSMTEGFITDKTGEEADFITVDKRKIGNRIFASFKLDGKGEEKCQFLIKNTEGQEIPDNLSSFSNYRLIKNDPYVCDSIYDFEVDYTYSYQDTVRGDDELENKTVTLEVHSECYAIASCEEEPLESYFTCDLKPGDVTNPFVNNILGSWKPYREYEYYTDRKGGKVDEAGYYSSFTPFTWNSTPSDDWVWQKETTLIDPYNARLEEKDPLGNYTAEIYGYSYTKTKATALNTPHNQTGFDSFEDYSYYEYVNNFGDCRPQKHIQFYLPAGTNYPGVPTISGQSFSYITDKDSHTGRHSAKVTSAAPVLMKRKVNPHQGGSSSGNSKEYPLKANDFVGIFTPKPGKYHVSAWVKDKLGFANFNTTTYDFPKIVMQADGTNINTLRASGPLVDGWQKIEGTVEIPENTNEVTIKLATDFGLSYFDDFRIHPFDAQMQAFVYNPYNLRHIATLDHNNFATFFQYNEEGEFMGSKKETSNGIITVRESRQGTYKSEK